VDPAYQSTGGKAAIYTRLSKMSAEQRREMTVAARAAQRKKIEDEVDPDQGEPDSRAAQLQELGGVPDRRDQLGVVRASAAAGG
jgi:hypothetical protein